MTAGCRPASVAEADEKVSAVVKYRPSTMLIDREDSGMQAAIRQARREVDDFLIALVQPKPNYADFAVKAAFSTEDTVEHMWLVDVKFEHGLILGTLSNTPELVTGYASGETYAVTPEEITDWYYYDNDHLHGGFTIQVLLARGDS